MSKILQHIMYIVVKQFKIVWIVFTMIVLVCCLYINWYLSTNRSIKELSNVARDLSNNVDRFIEDIFQEVYTLPVYGKNISRCANGILPDLQHITINNPKISGIIFRDNQNQLVCSTLPDNESFITTSQVRTIQGPFKLVMFEQPIYLLQQKLGKYYISIVLVSSVIERVLHSRRTTIDSVALYNSDDKKNLMRIEHQSDRSNWKISTNLELLSPSNTHSLFAIDKLQSINGLSVVVFENHKTLILNLWYVQILIILTTLLISSLVYLMMRNLISKRYSLLGAMKMAIKNREFYPVYQPVFDRNKGQFSGAEVLLRWQENQDEIIMPDFFIQEAETTGLIVPITLQIVKIAFQETQALLSSSREFFLSFNLSALHFTDNAFFKEFYQLCKDYQISPQQILFEITERDLLDKNDAIFIKQMEELIHFGYSLAVDDYGTGHASISYLQHFPFNYLKIDQIFVGAIGTEAITKSLIDAIIQMAKSLNLIIIAEGVETEEQVRYLSANDVRFLQGWYFSKALKIEQLLTLTSISAKR